MANLRLGVKQLELSRFSKDKNAINTIFFDFDIKDLKNQNTGNKIISFLCSLEKQGINYKIVNFLPRCVFSEQDSLKVERFGLIKSCFDCNKLFRISYSNQVEFCNGAKGKFVDIYKNKMAMYSDFITSHRKHKIPTKCKTCVWRTDCSYGCIYRKENLSYRYPSDKILDDSTVQNVRSLVETNEKFFSFTRIFCFPSYKCNNDCLYCFLGDKSNRGEPNLDFLKETIEQNSNKFSEINFGGGEPTLYKHILELITLAKEKGLKVQMFSNGRRFADKNFTGEILNAGIDWITETIHSCKPKVHDFITQRKGSFKQLLQGIENLHALGFSGLHLMVIIHKQNYKDLRKIAAFLLTLKPQMISFDALVLSGNAVKNIDILEVRMVEIVPFLEDAFDLLINKGINFFTTSFPLCIFQQKYWKHFRNHRYVCSIENFRSHNFSDRYVFKPSGQSLSAKCLDCMVKRYCPGTWWPYYSFFGDNEFKPIILQSKINLYRSMKFKERGLTVKPKVAESIVFRKEDGEALLINQNTGEIMILNPTGTFIWKLCDGKHTKEEIVDKLLGKFSIDSREAVAKDLDSFLISLKNQGVIEIA